MKNRFTRKEMLEDMKANPEDWANMVFKQQDTITKLSKKIKEYQIRIIELTRKESDTFH